MRLSLIKGFLLSAALAATCSAILTPVAAHSATLADSTQARPATLEKSAGGRLGISAFYTAGDKLFGYRADERFPMCSTFKVLVAAAALKQSMTDPDYLQRRITYTQADLLSWAPITKEHVAEGMSVADLCAAALQYSDNTATNLLMKLLGGPQAVTAFARSIGDTAFRLDRWEPELNSALPGDERDTTTPEAMQNTLRRLTLGDALGPTQRTQLLDWLNGNTTGKESIRAGVPSGWTVGDKTGSGSYGTTNDIGVIRLPSGEYIVVAIYFTQNAANAPARRDVLAAAVGIVLDGFQVIPAAGE